MTRPGERFTPLQRVLHWLMAAMVLAMLFIGIGMVSTLQPRFLVLIAIHKPLGIAVVGGLIFSQMLTLYTTPVVYLYLDRFRLWSLRVWRERHPDSLSDLGPANET